MKQIIVIGGGAAGLMAAVIAGREGARVILLEKMNMYFKYSNFIEVQGEEDAV